MEIKEGTSVKTLIGKKTSQGLDDNVWIPKGTEGLVCELYVFDAKHYALVEIWGPGIPEEWWGVYEYELSEIEVL